MIEIIRSYIVKEEYRGQFELSFGPGGYWSRLFSRSPGFRGITLLRDREDPRRYLAVEVWDEEGQRDDAMTAGVREVAGFQPNLDAWIESDEYLGTFTYLAQASVRPTSKPRRR